MYKSKDGKVMASLTEVKNKTGDIFALVDEFGEVVLTSYNKPRYRIVKIGVSDMLKTEIPEEPKPVASKSPASVISKVVEKVSVITKKSEPVAETEETTLLTKDVIAKFSKLKSWDRVSKQEKRFVEVAKKPLQ